MWIDLKKTGTVFFFFFSFLLLCRRVDINVFWCLYAYKKNLNTTTIYALQLRLGKSLIYLVKIFYFLKCAWRANNRNALKLFQTSLYDHFFIILRPLEVKLTHYKNRVQNEKRLLYGCLYEMQAFKLKYVLSVFVNSLDCFRNSNLFLRI